jgi:hypothetical protein
MRQGYEDASVPGIKENAATGEEEEHQGDEEEGKRRLRRTRVSGQPSWRGNGG